MWKESLRIGVESIDEQHKELFLKTEKLLRDVQKSGKEHKQECISTILFLKEYAVRHFTDEENYQKSVGYKDYEAHKELHGEFIKTVLEHEKKMIASDFAQKDIKAFTGTLTAWLLYHVAGIDQKIGKEEEQPAGAVKNHSELVCEGVFHVLDMIGLDSMDMKIVNVHNETFEDSFAIESELTGDTSGYIVIDYPVSFVRNLIYTMMNYTPDIIDELEISALFEVSNIISGDICRRISKENGIVCEIKMPHIAKRSDIHPDEQITIDTGIGIIEADLTINYENT